MYKIVFEHPVKESKLGISARDELICETEAGTFKDALRIVHDAAESYHPILGKSHIVSANDSTTDDEIEKDFSTNGIGNREWSIYRAYDVASSVYDFAVIEEERS